MRNCLILTLLFFVTVSIKAQEGINWFHGSFQEVLAESAKQDRLVFLDAYADWCGPCQYMMNEVFPKPEIYNYINEHFVAYKVNVDDDGTEYLQDVYGVKSIPTFLFLKEDGTVVKRYVGSSKPEEFLRKLKTVIAESEAPIVR